jgi:hypothetical protein
VKVVVTSVGHVGKRFVPSACSQGVTPKKDLWLYLCVKIPVGIKESFRLKGRLRTILRLGGQAEPAEVGVLRQRPMQSKSKAMHNEIMFPFSGPPCILVKIGSPRRWPSSLEPLQRIFLQLVLYPSDILCNNLLEK